MMNQIMFYYSQFSKNEDRIQSYITKNRDLYQQTLSVMLSKPIDVPSQVIMKIIENNQFKDYRIKNRNPIKNKDEEKIEDSIVKIIRYLLFNNDFQDEKMFSTEGDAENILHMFHQFNKGNFAVLKNCKTHDIIGLLLMYLSYYDLFPPSISNLLVIVNTRLSSEIDSTSLRIQSIQLVLMILTVNQRKILFLLLQLLEVASIINRYDRRNELNYRMVAGKIFKSPNGDEDEKCNTNLKCLLKIFPKGFLVPRLFDLEFHKISQTITETLIMNTFTPQPTLSTSRTSGGLQTLKKHMSPIKLINSVKSRLKELDHQIKITKYYPLNKSKDVSSQFLDKNDKFYSPLIKKTRRSSYQASEPSSK